MKKESGFKSLIFLIAVMTVSCMILTVVSEFTYPVRKKKSDINMAKKIYNCIENSNQISNEKLLAYFNKGKIIDVLGYKLIDFNDNNKKYTAVIFTGPGLWDRITSVIVVSPGLTKKGFIADMIYGLRILEQKETPGLGGRIEEKEFYNQFSNMDIKNKKVTIVNGKKKSKPNEVDGITGATITGKCLQNAIRKVLKDLKEHYKKDNS